MVCSINSFPKEKPLLKKKNQKKNLYSVNHQKLNPKHPKYPKKPNFTLFSPSNLTSLEEFFTSCHNRGKTNKKHNKNTHLRIKLNKNNINKKTYFKHTEKKR